MNIISWQPPAPITTSLTASPPSSSLGGVLAVRAVQRLRTSRDVEYVKSGEYVWVVVYSFVDRGVYTALHKYLGGTQRTWHPSKNPILHPSKSPIPHPSKNSIPRSSSRNAMLESIAPSVTGALQPSGSATVLQFPNSVGATTHYGQSLPTLGALLSR